MFGQQGLLPEGTDQHLFAGLAAVQRENAGGLGRYKTSYATMNSPYGTIAVPMAA